MKILITGASGLLGGRLLNYLSNQDYSIKAVSRNIDNLDFCDESVQKIQINWKNKNEIFQMCEGIDVIIHAAGPNANDCLNKKLDSEEFYSKITKNLADAAVECNVKKVIFFSTIHVYGNPLEGTVREDSKKTNDHPYAIYKMIGEDILQKHLNAKLDYYIVRLSNGYGYPLSKNINNWLLFANNICKQAIETREIKIKGNSGQYRDFIPISSICNVVKQMINSNLPSDIYNLGSGIAVELITFANIIKERLEIITGKKIKIITNNNNQKYNPFFYKIDKLTKKNCLFKIDHKSEIDQLIDICLKNFHKK